MDDEGEALSSLQENHPEIADLVLQLMLALSEQNRRCLSELVGNLQGDNSRLRGTINYIIDRISCLISGPYMPTPAMISNALYPTDEQLEPYIKRERERYK